MVKQIYIDSDSLLYRAAHLAGHSDKDLSEAEAIEEDGDDLGLEDAVETDSLADMKRIFHSMAREIIKAVMDDSVAKGYAVNPEPTYVLTVKGKLEICSALSDNFRYDIMTDVEDPAVKGYKSNRAGMEVPDGLNEIYEYVFNLEETICIGGVEADDVCVYYGRQGHIVAALDKDVLGSLEYAYNFGKFEWVENTPEEIMKFPYFQTITGDTSDGLRGVYRVGKVGANKALAGCTTHYDMWKAVVMQYVLKDQTIEEAIATMRCVLMNQWSPENGLVYWQPPKRDINTVQTFNADPKAPQWKDEETGKEIPND